MERLVRRGDDACSSNYTSDLPLAASVTRGIPMARLAHRKNVAQDIGAASGLAVNFPLSSKHRIAASSVMATGFHCALAVSASSFVNIFSNSHFPASFPLSSVNVV